jgi:alpha-L-fucosidase 2
MIWGGIDHERISLDESTCWAGEPSSKNNRPDGPRMVQQIRREMFEGNLIEAYSMAKGITGRKLNYGTNLPLGNLRLDFSHPDGDVHDYRRDLNLDTAVASVSYRVGQASFRRQVFASNPDHVIVVRLSCDRPSCLSCRISLDGAENPFGTRTHGHDTILLDGQAYETIHSDGKTGVSFHGRLQVVARGGETSAEDGRILVDGADTVILVVGLGTTFDGNDPVQACRGQVETAMARGYSSLLRDHVADHQQLFRRVVLDLGPSPHPELPTDERVKLVSRGRTDPHLSALPDVGMVRGTARCITFALSVQ